MTYVFVGCSSEVVEQAEALSNLVVAEPGDDFVGIDVSSDQDQRSFTRRAVAVRRAIAGQVIRDLTDRRAVSIEADGDELVLVRATAA